MREICANGQLCVRARWKYIGSLVYIHTLNRYWKKQTTQDTKHLTKNMYQVVLIDTIFYMYVCAVVVSFVSLWLK